MEEQRRREEQEAQDAAAQEENNARREEEEENTGAQEAPAQKNYEQVSASTKPVRKRKDEQAKPKNKAQIIRDGEDDEDDDEENEDQNELRGGRKMGDLDPSSKFGQDALRQMEEDDEEE